MNILNSKNQALLITICARGGSKGVKGKNVKILNGKPLIYYTVKQAKEWGQGKHVIVTTDSEEIAKVARECGAEVPFLRPAEMATDTISKLPAIRHALKFSEELYKEKYDLVVDLDPTAPIRKTSDLENALNSFLEKLPKTLFSVVPAHRNPYFNMVEEDSEGKAHLIKTGDFFSRQSAPKAYDMNASIYIYSRDFLMDETNMKPISDNSIIYIMDEISRFDIDAEVDFKFIEFLLKEGIISL